MAESKERKEPTRRALPMPKMGIKDIRSKPSPAPAPAKESRIETHKRILQGAAYKEFDIIAKKSGLPRKLIIEAVQVKERTLERRRKEGIFKPDESERLYRFEHVVDLATQVIGPAAKDWLSEPHTALGGMTPIELMATEAGAREVEEVLQRIDYGVYS